MNASRSSSQCRGSILLLVFLLAGVWLGCESPPQRRIGDGQYTVEATAGGRVITLSRRDTVLLAFGADAFQLGTVPALDDKLNYDPYQAEPEDDQQRTPLDGLTWRSVSQATIAAGTQDAISIQLAFVGGDAATLDLSLDASGSFQGVLRPTVTPEPVAFLRIVAHCDRSEAFYGLGEWGDQLNHRGRRRPMQAEIDFSLENRNNENHVPVPLLIGTRGWGLLVANRRAGMFDVARKQPDAIEVTYGTAEQSAAGLTFHLFAAEHPLDVTRHYYDVTGAPRLPAPWALGPWIWRDGHQTQAQVLDDFDKIRDLDLATSGYWIDNPFQTAVNTFDFASSMFPDPAAMVRRADELGLRMAVWSTPYLGEKAQPLLDQATQAGYFPSMSGVYLNQWGPPIDFTNPAAKMFWQGLISNFTRIGIVGFKLDYGEDVVTGINGSRVPWRFANGEDERTMHDGYTLAYHQVYAERLPADGGYFLCRAGRWGDQKYVAVIWPGDLDATFTRKGETFTDPRNGKRYTGVGGFPVALADGLSLGPSGFPFFGADTGGYIHSPPSKELFIRWVEQTALSTVMNVGDSSAQTPWEFTADNGRDTEALDIYRTYARLHMRLFPYEWTYARALATTGRTITRALGLAYPELGVHPDDTYLFGDDLLVAPVIVADARTRTAMLPPGDWVDWWDGSLHSGGAEVVVDAPLGKLPLLLRAGGIVPLLRPTIDTMAPTTQPARVDSFATSAGPLYARLVAGHDGAFTVYDGTQLSSTTSSVGIAPGAVFVFGAVFELLRASRPSSVTIDDAPLAAFSSKDLFDQASSGWLWEAALAGTLSIKLPGGAHVASWH